jgi:hypothetical protein
MIDHHSPGDRTRRIESTAVFMERLMTADWESPTSPIQFSSNLTMADVEQVDFLYNTRLLLTVLADNPDKAANATDRGNLNRRFVARISEQLKLPANGLERIREICKVVNEPDVWPLHIARIIAQCAGLIACRNKRFQVTKAGRALLADGQVGALYRRLFIAYFRGFNLRYAYPFGENPEIQPTLAVTFWLLDKVAREWVPVRGLSEKILIPPVLERVRRALPPYARNEESILCGYVLQPLFKLGLIEQTETDKEFGISDLDHIRVSPLWKKFIRFVGEPLAA